MKRLYARLVLALINPALSEYEPELRRRVIRATKLEIKQERSDDFMSAALGINADLDKPGAFR